MVYRAKKSNFNGEKKIRYDRLNLLAVVVFVFSFFLVYRLFQIQVLKHSDYTALASGQHRLFEKLLPERGKIYVRDRANPDKLFALATNQKLHFVYAVPKEIEDPEESAQKISEILNLDEEVILRRFSKKDDLFEPVKRGVSDEKWEEVNALGLKGIKTSPENYRFYPEGEIGAHILGFVGEREESEEKSGQYGLEGYFNKELAGIQGHLKTERDAGGRWITVGGIDLKEAQDGDDLILTIDHTIQYTACQRLNSWVLQHGADGGSLIIMDPKTGAILAMCGSPDFDPNKYNEVNNIEVYKNPATYYTYEPGSVFKPITMAAALDKGVVTPQSTYVDEGEEKIGVYTIRNSDLKAHGEQTMIQVLEKSLNTGAIFAMRQLGEEGFYKYVKDFGFGEKTGLELDVESSGNISNLKNGREIYSATASFGQGITVTPLQLINAFSAIANKGLLMKPYIVEEIVKADGARIKTKPEQIRQVISPQTATTVTAMLVNVVENGHGTRAAAKGYYVAGKTGTAQVSKKNGIGYEQGHTIGSFAGFAPASDPKFVMLVKIDRPRSVQWAESSAAPLFGEIAKFLLNYFEVPPSRETE